LQHPPLFLFSIVILLTKMICNILKIIFVLYEEEIRRIVSIVFSGFFSLFTIATSLCKGVMSLLYDTACNTAGGSPWIVTKLAEQFVHPACRDSC